MVISVNLRSGRSRRQLTVPLVALDADWLTAHGISIRTRLDGLAVVAAKPHGSPS